jgi:hypothetical protein
MKMKKPVINIMTAVFIGTGKNIQGIISSFTLYLGWILKIAFIFLTSGTGKNILPFATDIIFS